MVIHDTSNLTHGSLKERIAAAFVTDRPVRLGVTRFVAFGFKFGLPTDLDLLSLDVRFLRNLNYVESLAIKTPVTIPPSQLRLSRRTRRSLHFSPKVTDLIDFLLPCYLAEARVAADHWCRLHGRPPSLGVCGGPACAARFSSDRRIEVALEARDLVQAA